MTVGVVLVLIRFLIIIMENVRMSRYRILLCSVPGCLDTEEEGRDTEATLGRDVNLISGGPRPASDHFQFSSSVSGLCQTSDKLIVTFV